MSAVPKLRFPEFDGDLQTKEAKDIAQIYDGTHQTPKYVDKGVPFFSVENLTSGNFEKTKFISEEVYEKECRRVKIEQGDVLMTRIGDIGTVKYVNWPPRASFYVSLALLKFTESVISEYMSHYMRANSFQAEIWRRTIHVAFPKKINLGEIGNCKVAFPSLPEQQKIASFLSSVDKKIDLLRQKKDALELYKKGLMQKIFSQEIRFNQDDGSDFPDWEEVNFGDKVVSITNGTTEPQVSYRTNYPVTRIETISNRTINPDKVGYLVEQPVDKYMIVKGDILFSHINSVTHIGKTALYEGEDGMLFHGMNLLLIRVGSEMSYKFAFYLLNHSSFQREVRRKTKEAVSQASINTSDIRTIRCWVPDIAEQQKIASFLSVVDTKIQNISSQIDQMETFKKGLLQQMFV